MAEPPEDEALAESIQMDRVPRKISRAKVIATVPQTDTGE
jgi:hypothetical protein